MRLATWEASVETSFFTKIKRGSKLEPTASEEDALFTSPAPPGLNLKPRASEEDYWPALKTISVTDK